jgi:hypothetical protein
VSRGDDNRIDRLSTDFAGASGQNVVSRRSIAPA